VKSPPRGEVWLVDLGLVNSTKRAWAEMSELIRVHTPTDPTTGLHAIFVHGLNPFGNEEHLENHCSIIQTGFT
jgi:hypothetical protein